MGWAAAGPEPALVAGDTQPITPRNPSAAIPPRSRRDPAAIPPLRSLRRDPSAAALPPRTDRGGVWSTVFGGSVTVPARRSPLPGHWWALTRRRNAKATLCVERKDSPGHESTGVSRRKGASGHESRLVSQAKPCRGPSSPSVPAAEPQSRGTDVSQGDTPSAWCSLLQKLRTEARPGRRGPRGQLWFRRPPVRSRRATAVTEGLE